MLRRSYCECRRESACRNLQIVFPSLPIQKKIVQKLDDILGQLEEKKKAVFSIIEQNKEKIDFFEKNWFSYLIDREIEHHPQRKEWEVIPLKDITNALGDGIHSTPNYVQNSEFYSKSVSRVDFCGFLVKFGVTVGLKWG